ncbi:unnamed protein product, partial [Lepidochelys kempii]
RVHGFLCSNDVVISVTGWRPGAGYTNIMRVVKVAFQASASKPSHQDCFPGIIEPAPQGLCEYITSITTGTAPDPEENEGGRS